MPSFLEPVFEFLFKYRPIVFENGRFALDASRPASMAVLAALALGALALVTYARAPRGLARRDAIALGVLRTVALLLVAFCLLRPVMVLSTAVPQRNVLGILVDDSRSMQIADADGKRRSAFVRRALGGPDSTLLKALSERFLVRLFRFDGSLARIASVCDLEFAGDQTRLLSAVDGARQDLATAPLAGLVLITDGADNDLTTDRSTPFSFGRRELPVYTVGVGKEQLGRDLELSRVDGPRAVLKGASLGMNVTVRQRGYDGTTVQIVVEDSGRIVASHDVALARDRELTTTRVFVPTAAAGARQLEFRVAARPDEMVAENNAREALVVVSDRREKILYIEGEPRFELKFIRRAVADDENLQLVTLQRTAEKKFLRLSVDDSLELVDGFPRTRDELFNYRGIILGSIEASSFTGDQLRMIADFVSERGGGLLMLGGRRSFAEGGYAETPLAEALPVILEPPAAADSFFAEVAARPTPAGSAHAAMQIAGSERESAARWTSLPPLTTVNRVRRLKPGATTLLQGSGAEVSDVLPLLSFQRFGRGKAVAFPVQDSWMWQMHASMSLEDQTYETFWRQMLRWLVSGVPDRVELLSAAEVDATGQEATVRAEVRDRAYLGVNDAQVTARITSPTGDDVALPLEWTGERDGEYAARFTPPGDGLYHVQVTARTARDTLVGSPTFFRSAKPNDEYFDAGMRAPLLKRIAEETGGRFYTPATIAALPRDIVYSARGTTVLQRLDLWDMPIVFLMFVLLVGTEWGYRRARGLP
jgi:uncharacterized membrane protein